MGWFFGFCLIALLAIAYSIFVPPLCFHQRFARPPGVSCIVSKTVGWTFWENQFDPSTKILKWWTPRGYVQYRTHIVLSSEEGRGGEEVFLFLNPRFKWLRNPQRNGFAYKRSGDGTWLKMPSPIRGQEIMDSAEPHWISTGKPPYQLIKNEDELPEFIRQALRSGRAYCGEWSGAEIKKFQTSMGW
jgi:hypothetical protein